MENFYNKTQAAKYLGISLRTLQRDMRQGKIRITYRRTKSGRRIAMFKGGDLQRLKAERRRALVVAEKKIPISQNDQKKQLTLMRRIADALDIVVLANKLALTREEASKLSGYPLEQIKEAIKRNKLGAISTGRGWRVKRADLEKYVEQLQPRTSVSRF